MSFVLYFILVSATVISTTHYVDAKRRLSKVEEDDIEKQLKILNKKPVKTITTKIGDIIDCVDIYKQPAFDHPLLRDHKLQLAPSSIPGVITNKTNPSYSIFRGLQKKGCPSGTVPIRRTTRDDLVNAKQYMKKIEPFYANNTFPNTDIAYHFVAVEEVINGKQYYGALSSISTHDLTVYRGEFSTSQIWIVNGPINEINTIEFGLIHDPSLFRDSRARLYGSWTTDGHRSTGCRNMLCLGFMQISSTITFGQDFRASIYGKEVHENYFMVNLNAGNWWLNVGPYADAMVPVGYWPGAIFNHLNVSASVVRHGGFVSKTSRGSTPPMGNGHIPQTDDYSKTAFMSQMKYIDKDNNRLDIDPRFIEIKNSARTDCYNIIFDGNLGQHWDMTMVYGGPGGPTCA
ncbi:hypothetical protein MKW94_007895 [Papaver nudicaule]|uniref:Neprosin PEP catalytic domain-containing protein n=1 Tax=Papaver nudicaule TaxID=74823 RepID=A0AA41VLI8_PAPNU|nr:hypothetical protein [Papaver nudicaule]